MRTLAWLTLAVGMSLGGVLIGGMALYLSFVVGYRRPIESTRSVEIYDHTYQMGHPAAQSISEVAVMEDVVIVGGVVLVVFMVIGAIVWLMSRSHHKRRGLPDDTRLMQEIHRGLSGLEQRVESLETILIDRSRM